MVELIEFMPLQERQNKQNVGKSTDVKEGKAVKAKEHSDPESKAVDFIADIKDAAQQAQQISGFIYESTSGLYYDSRTGYYYNAVRQSNQNVNPISEKLIANSRYNIRNMVFTMMVIVAVITLITKRKTNLNFIRKFMQQMISRLLPPLRNW